MSSNGCNPGRGANWPLAVALVVSVLLSPILALAVSYPSMQEAIMRSIVKVGDAVSTSDGLIGVLVPDSDGNARRATRGDMSGTGYTQAEDGDQTITTVCSTVPTPGSSLASREYLRISVESGSTNIKCGYASDCGSAAKGRTVIAQGAAAIFPSAKSKSVYCSVATGTVTAHWEEQAR